MTLPLDRMNLPMIGDDDFCHRATHAVNWLSIGHKKHRELQVFYGVCAQPPFNDICHNNTQNLFMIFVIKTVFEEIRSDSRESKHVVCNEVKL